MIITRLEFAESEETLIDGAAEIPLNSGAMNDPRKLLAQPGAVAVEITVRPTQLSHFYRIAGVDPAGLEGTIEGKLSAEGSLSKPLANLSFSLRDGLFESVDLDPLNADLEMRLMNGRADLDARIVQSEIQPIVIKGTIPFVPDSWFDEDRPGIEEAPIELVAKLPATSLERVSDWVPEIVRCDGALQADVSVLGTVGKPRIVGEMVLNVDRLRPRASSIPNLRDFAGRVRFLDDRIEIDEFSGVLAGGPFGLKGSVDIKEIGNPVFDLSLVAREALMYRTEDVNVRGNISLMLNGPLESASLGGEVALVNSRFVKEIDILPVAFPRRGPTLPRIDGPRAANRPPEVGVSREPFANWIVDLKLRTEDPFLIVGNLATAEIHSDLDLTGTLGKPKPFGEIRMENGVATLPFSEFKVDSCILSFFPEHGFDPKISVDGSSEVGGYQLRAHVYDSAFNPRSVLTSNPPLPEEDILSLLATGATRSELENAGSGQAMAKGGKILLEKMRQDMGLSDAEKSLIPRNLTFDVGGVNKRTGEPTVTAKLKLRKRLFILGDVDTQGEYRSVLKWAIRFR